MDALIASAGPIHRPKAGPSRQRPQNRKPAPHKTVDRGPNKESIDPTTHSILQSTRLPSSFHQSTLASGSGSTPLKPNASTYKIKDKKLKAKVGREDISTKRAQRDREDVNEWLNAPLAGRGVEGGNGGIEVDEDMGEKTWRVKQKEVVDAVGIANAKKKFDLKLDDMGEYFVDYTRNGRHLAIASSRGHVATFDWQAGKLHSEIHLKETVRDIKFLQSESFYAVAQKKYVFIYDQDGVELHKLKQHIDVTHLEFLPYHYLLTSLGHAGWLKYHDVSTGVLLTQIPTKLGSPTSMAQNPHSAIIHAGHANGTMTLWSPNMTTPHVKLLAHRGPITGIAIDPSEHSVGRYCATAGLDGTVKIWDGRMWGKELRSWGVRNTPSTLSFSQKGVLAVGGKSGVTVYNKDLTTFGNRVPDPYLTLPLPGLSANSTMFCPYDDVLAIGHGRGISSMLVPGSGEAQFDSNEADVYESHGRRREREVRGVLEKIRPELITLDTDFLGTVGEKPRGTYDEREARSYRQLTRVERLKLDGKAEGADAEATNGAGDEGSGDEEVTSGKKEKEKYKARGKSGSMKKYLRKKKKNVIDPSLLAMRQKVANQRKADDERRKVERGEIVKESGALARFG